MELVAVGLVVAIGTALLARGTERQRMLRERKLGIASDFSEAAMGALAALRHCKPAKSDNHRNSFLRDDHEALAERLRAAEAAIDVTRRLRGPVWVAFPGRSPEDQVLPVTTADWAEHAVGQLRLTLEACAAYWDAVQSESNLSSTQVSGFDVEYDRHKKSVWGLLDGFAHSVAKEVGAKPKADLLR